MLLRPQAGRRDGAAARAYRPNPPAHSMDPDLVRGARRVLPPGVGADPRSGSGAGATGAVHLCDAPVDVHVSSTGESTSLRGSELEPGRVIRSTWDRETLCNC